MHFTFAHNNINVFDLNKSLEFYKEALGLKEHHRMELSGFTLVYLTDGVTDHLLELTWLEERREPYKLGDNEIHLALVVDDFDAALKKHQEMGCVCFENREMGIYFINDPDGYWTEILPKKK